MPAPTRPVDYPIWTQGNNAARQQPTNGQQLTGFTPNFRPPAGMHNWLFGIASDWIAWLDYATQGNGPVSNAGHTILTGTTVQQQFDEADAFMSGLGLTRATLTETAPGTYTVLPLAINGSTIIPNVDGRTLDADEYTFVIAMGVATLTLTDVPAAGQTVGGFVISDTNGGGGGGGASGGYVAYGSTVAPGIVTGAGGITSTTDQRTMMFIKSNGGVVPVTSNPQITAGTKVGQELRIIGTSDVDSITLANGNGLFLNGPITIQNHTLLDLYWDGTVWAESERNN